MDKQQLKSDWDDLKDSVQQKWDELTDQDFSEIKGDKDKLISHIQDKYQQSKENATQEVNKWLAKFDK